MFVLISPSFALDNETSAVLADDYVEGTASTDIYVNASNAQAGDGSQSNPYNNLESAKLKSGSIVHIANGEYTYKSFSSLNNVTFVGEHTENTVIKCNFLEITSNNLILKNLTFDGATFKNQANFTAQNVVFKNSVGKFVDEYKNSYGGSIYTAYRENDDEKHLISLTDCSFINNFAEYGGAIYIDKGFLEINRCFFMNNHAYNYGGAISISNADKVTIRKSQFINDFSANDAGGAIYCLASSLVIDDVNITNCSSTFGAAITALNTKLDVNKLNACNNVAKYNGGAIYQMYSTSLISSSNFINNSAANGGALFLDNLTSLFLMSNKFINNSAKICAGAIYSILNKEYQNTNNSYANNSATLNNDVYNTSAIKNIITSSNYTSIRYTPQGDIILPSRYNLVDDGFVSPVKDQQDSGNCWSFSAMATLESCILKAINKTYDLSEENMKNVMALFSDYGWRIDVNDGGYDDMAIGYLVGWLGPVNESDDRFDDNGALSPILDSLFHIQNIVYLKRNSYLDNDAIKEAILRYGAVSTGIYYSGLYLLGNSYYYHDSIMPSNHAVTIVGWDDNYSRYNFNRVPEGDGAFIVKNSWGDDWCDNGFFYVSYYDKKFAQVGENEVSYTFILNDTIKFNKNYQYDVAGKTDYIVTGEKTLWYQNIFNATDDEYLAAVSTYFTELTEWEVFIYVNDVFKTTASGISNAGYYTFNLGDLVHLNKGDVFKVIFKITAEEHAKIPILEKKYINKVPFGFGVSYFSRDGENWTDLFNFTFADFNRRCESQVACIKAFTIFNALNSTIKLDISDRGIGSFNIKASVCDQYGNPINSGNVTFTIDGVQYTVNVTKGIAKMKHVLQNNAKCIVNAVFNNENYRSSSDDAEVEFYTADIQLDVEDITYGQFLIANIVLMDNNGNLLNDDINLTIGNKTYNVQVNGSNKFYLPTVLEVGLYNITANYCDKLTKQVVVNVSQSFVSMDVSLVETRNNLTVNIQFSKLINEQVNITVSGKRYSVTTKYGKASLFLDDLDYGKHDIVVSFINKNYNNVCKNYTVETAVYKTIISPVKMEYVNVGVFYSVKLTKLDNTPIVGKELTFMINNVEYKNITDSNGVSGVLFNLVNGNYAAKVSFDGHDDVVGYSLNTNLSVNRPVVGIQNIASPNEIRVYDNEYIKVTFSNNANGNLTVMIDENEYINCRFTDNMLEIPLSDLEIGNHKISVLYEGIEGYNYYNVFKVSVIKSNPVIDVVFGDCHAGQKISFTFNLPVHATGYLFVDVGGKNYFSKVDNGKAVIVIEGLGAGKKQLTYSYDGDNNYNDLNGTIAFNVVNKFKITSNKDIFMFYTDGSTYKVKVLTSNGSVVKSGNVIVTIDGKSYKVKIDKNGWASFKITLKPKTYTISAKYGDAKVSNKIVVKSILKSNNYNVKKSAKKLTVKAYLSKVNGKYLKGKSVTFKLNGKKYIAKTNSKGVAQLVLNKQVISKLKINKKYVLQISYLKNSINKAVVKR